MILDNIVQSKDDFMNLLKENPGHIVIKFGADWCRPCKAIKPIVDKFFNTSNNSIYCIDVDIDESLDLFGFLKTKRIVNGVPAILVYKAGNEHYIPDDSVLGGNMDEVRLLFERITN